MRFSPAVVIFLSSVPLSAFESFPEFTTLTESEESTPEVPTRLSTDYSVIIQSFQKPVQWEHAWLTHEIAFDASVGSLDGSHFMMNDRAKLRRFLSDNIEFRFTYFTEQDFEQNSLFHILELIDWINPSFGISLYGEPFYFKRQNNLGIAAVWKPEEHHEVRFFNTFVNLVRNERNDQPDGFVAPNLPYAFGIVGRLWSEKDFAEYALRYETFTRWNFPQSHSEFDYWKKFASLFSQKTFAQNFSLSVRLQYDQKYVSQFPVDTSSTVAPVSFRKDRFQSILRGKFLNWHLTPGFSFNSRSWQFDAGPVTYLDYIPHVIWEIPAYRRATSLDNLTIEYDLFFHSETGPGPLRNLSTPGTICESRIDTSYGFNFGSESTLRFMGTFNLNYLLAGKPWGGGDAQLKAAF